MFVWWIQTAWSVSLRDLLVHRLLVCREPFEALLTASHCYVSFYFSITPFFFYVASHNLKFDLIWKTIRSVAREFSMTISKPKRHCELFLISSISYCSRKIRVLLKFLIKEILVQHSQKKNIAFALVLQAYTRLKNWIFIVIIIIIMNSNLLAYPSLRLCSICG